METDLEAGLREAIAHFWNARSSQQGKQGAKTGKRDAGTRGAVTGGKQLDGFLDLLARLLIEAGLGDSSIHSRNTCLPGYFRASKKWDMVAVAGGRLIATLELKSQVGSFGNNVNNRVEEALGCSADLLTAYSHGMFEPSGRPWMGWLMLVEDCEKSTQPVSVGKTHFQPDGAFRAASYIRRYEVFCKRLMRERYYDAACLICSSQTDGPQGAYFEPCVELSFRSFAASLYARAVAFAKVLEFRQASEEGAGSQAEIDF